jgi:serine protease Do
VGGVVFASGMDLTRFGWAQTGTSTTPVALTPVNGLVPEGTGSIADVAERVTPAVVSIRATRAARPRASNRNVPPGMEEFLEQFERQQPREQTGDGSGFIVNPDGYIITNNHVVAGATVIDVVLSDRRRFRARIIGTDSTTDIAVIKIDGARFPSIPLGDDEKLRIGDWVVAVGNPLGLDFTVTAGIVSSKNRGSEVSLPNSGGLAINDFIQTDAAINPGNSGGPLINLRGEVIGVNSAIASQTGFYSGYGFAIPITLAKAVMEDLIRDGKVRLPVIGITVTEVDPEDAGLAGLSRIAGVKVQSVTQNGPAIKAGIEPGDVIVSVGGKDVDRVSALQRTVRSNDVGQTIEVVGYRFGKKRTFKVTLQGAESVPALVANNGAASPSTPSTEPASPSRLPASKLGITVESLTPEAIATMNLSEKGGLRVTDVASDGAAYGKLVAGRDIILEITYPGERRPVKSVADLRAVVDALQPGDYVGLRIMSRFANGTQTSSVTLQVPK